MPGDWEVRASDNVLCAILTVETVTSHWAKHFRNLQIPGPPPEFLSGMPFDHARNAGCQALLSSRREWLFFLDSDVCPPPDAVHRLLAHNKPVISGVYHRRSPPHGVPVMMRNYQWVTELPAANEPQLIEVDFVGAGCLLIHRSVLEALAQRPHPPGKPWFHWRVDLDTSVPLGEAVSEDFSFCQRVRRELGIPILVDCSVRCLHIGTAEASHGSLLPAGSTPVHLLRPQ
jgi:hypothetical protein